MFLVLQRNMVVQLMRLAGVVLLVAVIYCENIHDGTIRKGELEWFQERNRQLYNLLVSKKCVPASEKWKNALLSPSKDGIRLVEEQEIHNKLLDFLVLCGLEKLWL